MFILSLFKSKRIVFHLIHQIALTRCTIRDGALKQHETRKGCTNNDPDSQSPSAIQTMSLSMSSPRSCSPLRSSLTASELSHSIHYHATVSSAHSRCGSRYNRLSRNSTQISAADSQIGLPHPRRQDPPLSSSNASQSIDVEFPSPTTIGSIPTCAEECYGKARDQTVKSLFYQTSVTCRGYD